jgi:plasmid maintenance system antidote protein VapI
MGNKISVLFETGEKYVKEVGVMACIVKKLYGNRSEFLRDVDAGYDQKEAKKNKEPIIIAGAIAECNEKNFLYPKE